MRTVGLILLFALTFSLPAWPQGEKTSDSNHTFIVQSKYFSVYGPPQFDIINVLNKMDYDYFLQVEGLFLQPEPEPKMVLANTLDAVFLETCKILGINVYSFEASLEFLEDQQTLKIAIKNLVGVDIQERAFYLHDLKTIYVSIEDLTPGVLGHELAHAIISHYFGAPPSENIQEILAGYVDYSFRKSAQSSGLK
jgi:hypothetical protein